jgi:translation initiation factor IF-3
VVQGDGRLSEKPIKLAALLKEIDQTTEFIELVKDGEKPIVKIRNKKEVMEQEKKFKIQRAATRVVQKEIQVSWVISSGDMKHKISQACGYLEKGHRVSVVFTPKRGQLPPPPDVCNQVIQEALGAIGETGTVQRMSNEGKGITSRTIAYIIPKTMSRPVPIHDTSKQEGDLQDNAHSESSSSS